MDFRKIWFGSVSRELGFNRFKIMAVNSLESPIFEGLTSKKSFNSFLEAAVEGKLTESDIDEFFALKKQASMADPFYGRTLLHGICQNKCAVQLIRKFMSCIPSDDNSRLAVLWAKDFLGRTPLHYLVLWGDPEGYEALNEFYPKETGQMGQDNQRHMDWLFDIDNTGYSPYSYIFLKGDIDFYDGIWKQVKHKKRAQRTVTPARSQAHVDKLREPIRDTATNDNYNILELVPTEKMLRTMEPEFNLFGINSRAAFLKAIKLAHPSAARYWALRSIAKREVPVKYIQNVFDLNKKEEKSQEESLTGMHRDMQRLEAEINTLKLEKPQGSAAVQQKLKQMQSIRAHQTVLVDDIQKLEVILSRRAQFAAAFGNIRTELYCQAFQERNIDTLDAVLKNDGWEAQEEFQPLYPLVKVDDEIPPALFYAVRGNQIELVRLLMAYSEEHPGILEMGSGVYDVVLPGTDLQKQVFKCSVAYLALMHSDDDAAFLLEALYKDGQGVNIDLLDGNSFTPAYYAFSNKKPEALRFLLEHGVSLDTAQGEQGESLLMIARRYGNDDSYKEVIEVVGESYNMRFTNLNELAQMLKEKEINDQAVQLYMQSNGLGWQTVDPDGGSILHYLLRFVDDEQRIINLTTAILNERIKANPHDPCTAVERFIEGGDCYQRTIVHLAAQQGFSRFFNIIMQFGTSKNWQNWPQYRQQLLEEGFMYDVDAEEVEASARILTRDDLARVGITLPELDVQDSRIYLFFTPLAIAALAGDLELMRALMQYEVQLNSDACSVQPIECVFLGAELYKEKKEAPDYILPRLQVFSQLQRPVPKLLQPVYWDEKMAGHEVTQAPNVLHRVVVGTRDAALVGQTYDLFFPQGVDTSRNPRVTDALNSAERTSSSEPKWEDPVVKVLEAKSKSMAPQHWAAECEQKDKTIQTAVLAKTKSRSTYSLLMQEGGKKLQALNDQYVSQLTQIANDTDSDYEDRMNVVNGVLNDYQKEYHNLVQNDADFRKMEEIRNTLNGTDANIPDNQQLKPEQYQESFERAVAKMKNDLQNLKQNEE